MFPPDMYDGYHPCEQNEKIEAIAETVNSIIYLLKDRYPEINVDNLTLITKAELKRREEREKQDRLHRCFHCGRSFRDDSTEIYKVNGLNLCLSCYVASKERREKYKRELIKSEDKNDAEIH